MGRPASALLYGKDELARGDAAVPGRRRHDQLGHRFEKTTCNALPHKFEAGTPHIAGAIGLGAAID